MQDKSTSHNQLLEPYLQRITPDLNRPQLAQLLEGEILSSFQVVQSALITLTSDDHLIPLYCRGLAPQQLPSDIEVFRLLDLLNKYRPLHSRKAGLCPWARLILPLMNGNALIGFWLFGQRDPDRPYWKFEISALSTIASHVAISLMMIAERERIRAIYQANIDRNENERGELARDLHDDILNQLAGLIISGDAMGISQEAFRKVESVIMHVRQMISTLRPGMLDYGLRAALEGLVGNLSYLAGGHTSIKLDVPKSDIRYDVRIEEYIFRIVQSACENALRHAQARVVRISGKLEPEAIDLSIVDNGVGFCVGKRPEMAQWLKNRHFGLAGMFERADLIDAALKIKSSLGNGTEVRVNWAARIQEEDRGGCI